jgi:hypothetical protein
VKLCCWCIVLVVAMGGAVDLHAMPPSLCVVIVFLQYMFKCLSVQRAKVARRYQLHRYGLTLVQIRVMPCCLEPNCRRAFAQGRRWISQ